MSFKVSFYTIISNIKKKSHWYIYNLKLSQDAFYLPRMW